MADCSNKLPCACTYSCGKRQKCCECVAYHRDRGELPGCFFSTTAEKTYDRSIQAFIRDQQKK